MTYRETGLPLGRLKAWATVLGFNLASNANPKCKQPHPNLGQAWLSLTRAQILTLPRLVWDSRKCELELSQLQTVAPNIVLQRGVLHATCLMLLAVLG